jgi:hypothetical protein
MLVVEIERKKKLRLRFEPLKKTLNFRESLGYLLFLTCKIGLKLRFLLGKN